MSKYLKKVQKNNDADTSRKSAVLKKAQRTVYWQAGLALVTILLTVVIIFAMTSAWYTNVARTGGMVIKAESWGFDGQIKVDDSVIVAAPGDEGIISLEVNNTNASTTAVGVGVSKARITDYEMQKRLYFYVDTSLQRNEETMDRVYLNTQEGYTYTLFGGETLTLTEDMHNDVQLKWQWVYDVLGYYVLGSWNDATGMFTELEYLRPIEYDYDEATTTFGEDGDDLVMELKTVDGEQTVEEFLVEFSQKDGYEGEINPKQKKGTGYYPVSVDENNYGVYAYLCSYSEIEMATQYDTKLAQEAANATAAGTEQKKYEIQLLVSAQKNDEDVINVNSLEALKTALELDIGNVVQLTGDIVIPDAQRLVIPKGKQIAVDMNGHTITSNGDRAIMAEQNSNLTMTNGSVVGLGNSGCALYTTGAKVTFNQVKISEFKYGVYVGDSDDENEQDSTVRLIDCEISGSTCAVFISGNGTASEQKTQLVIEHCKLYGDSFALSGNGDAAGSGRWGTDIQIIDSELTGNPSNFSAGIYHPQMDSNLNIYNSTVSGYTGIAIKGGNVRVKASTVTGEGAAFEGTLNPIGSGFVDTGDGIYIEANYEYPITLEISSDVEFGRESIIKSTNNRSLRVYPEDASHVQVVLYGGQFDQEQPVIYLAPGATQTSKDQKYIITSMAS